MSKNNELRQQLLTLLCGGNSHMGFDKAIAEFPREHINRRAPNISYTPYHILEHMRIAQWDILEFIRNPDHISPPWPDGYWPAPDKQADEAQWQQTIVDFQADLRVLQDLVTDPHTDLSAPIPHARNYTILREILVIADHNAYHIGEFAILRQVMQTWPPD